MDVTLLAGAMLAGRSAWRRFRRQDVQEQAQEGMAQSRSAREMRKRGVPEMLDTLPAEVRQQVYRIIRQVREEGLSAKKPATDAV